MKADQKNGALYLMYENPTEKERLYEFLKLCMDHQGLPLIMGILSIEETDPTKPVMGLYFEQVTDMSQLVGAM